mgnify:CR=1 FL=1
MPVKKEGLIENNAQWFYYTSILVSFLFMMYMSVYSAIHFEDIRYMNLVLIFFFFTIICFFLISAVYFHTEKMGYHRLAPVLFFAGVVGLMFYAYTANDASNIVRYSIIYTIVATGISLFILIPRQNVRQGFLKKLPSQKGVKEK